jgi:hypothetical protein
MYENYIASFIHCSLCIKEKPETVSPREWTNNEVGILLNGDIQVWCIRHEKNVGIFDMQTDKILVDKDVDTSELDVNQCACCVDE